ncbi:MAG: hypothetical protein KY464_14160 [Gemmatimonadetes bacterium]|nr:hypothetical protein [Gemmatimonadota bacterium]
MASDNATGLEALLSRLGEQDLPREVSYRNSAGESFASTVEDILVHLAMHGSYHRGRVALLLRQGDEEPAATGYIVFLRVCRQAVRRHSGRERTRLLGYDQ